MQQPLTQKQQYWFDQLEQAAQSGLSLAEYARTNNISAQRLYQWRSTLKNHVATTEIAQESHFARVVTTVPGSCLSVQLADAQLRFSSLPDSAWLADFLHRLNTQP